MYIFVFHRVGTLKPCGRTRAGRRGGSAEDDRGAATCRAGSDAVASVYRTVVSTTSSLGAELGRHPGIRGRRMVQQLRRMDLLQYFRSRCVRASVPAIVAHSHRSLQRYFQGIGPVSAPHLRMKRGSVGWNGLGGVRQHESQTGGCGFPHRLIGRGFDLEVQLVLRRGLCLPWLQECLVLQTPVGAPIHSAVPLAW